MRTSTLGIAIHISAVVLSTAGCKSVGSLGFNTESSSQPAASTGGGPTGVASGNGGSREANSGGSADLWPGSGGRCAEGDFEHPFIDVHQMGESTGRAVVSETIIEVVDLDGDRDLDVITTVYKDDSTIEVGWHKNLGNRKFSYTRITGEGLRRNTSVAVVDIDGDGDLDIVHGNDDHGRGWPGGLEIYENVGRAQAWKPRWLMKGDATGIFAGDLDGDGANDIVMKKDGKYVWMSNTAKNGTTWGKPQSFGDIGDVVLLEAHDFDRDGDLDFLYVKKDSELGWLENKKRGRSWSKHVIDSTGKVDKVELVDFDGDGDLDIIGGESQQIYGMFVFANVDGKGTFGTTKLLDRENYNQVTAITVGDLDGDKRPELLAGHFANGLYVFTYDDKQRACFVSVAYESKVGRVQSLAVADLDGDGDLDVLFSNQRANLRWLESSTR